MIININFITVSMFRCQMQYLQAARLDLEDLEVLKDRPVPKTGRQSNDYN